jgi:hypothetical protein
MKAIDKQINELQRISTLIEALEHQNHILRNIVGRYYAKHGNDAQMGFYDVPDSIEMSIGTDGVNYIDMKKIGMDSAQQRINKIKKSLNN